MADPPKDPHEAVLTHAWAWFAMHAQQRMQTVNFFLVVEGVLLSAVGVTAKEQLYGYQFAAGLLIVLMAVLFWAVDLRVRNLVRVGKAALQAEQAHLATQSSITAIELVKLSEPTNMLAPTYGRIFSIMFLVFIAIGVGVAAVACHALGWCSC